MTKMYDHLRQRGREFGIVFGNHTLLSNSRIALGASEYARDMGMFDGFHENMFRAYFTEALDIGNLDVVSSVAKGNGLDADSMMAAIQDGRYRTRLDEARREGRMLNLTGVPTFIINGKYKIVGAQPLDVFKEVIGKLK